MSKPVLAVTMGDIAGVGPEIIAKALRHQDVFEKCRPLIIGSERALRRGMEFSQSSFSFQTIQHGQEIPTDFNGVLLLNDESFFDDHLPLTAVDASAGASAFSWLDQGIQLALQKKAAAIVTAPLNKEALNEAGHHYAGHTEILAEKTGTKEYCLMLIAGRFRVVHVTCHTAIANVSSLLSRDRIVSAINLFDQALSRLDEERPRIAVCALNPHAGEGGLFGDEERRVILPAIEYCASEGVNVEGPFPSDSIFPQMVGGRYDGAVAMYHDQGHIAFKLINFGFDSLSKEWGKVSGVNVTLGLPIIRTSVDHGTAFDIAGSGKASEQSLLDAIDVALKLISRRHD
ncbi:MAG: 4-hydroxythreonine-4-phosphate dehydrogenase PdxA [Candidatus Omnitrophica bacterium]|nr:4-hydroxythreonine-4-phosphate dehydrogenase PdxA [Candidatus Omnitrophota bacterium]